MTEEKLKIDREGNFYKWDTVLVLDRLVESNASNIELGKISGFEFDKFLKQYVGKRVKVTVEVKNES